MIIFLNGCSSSGKTSIAHAIQHLSNEPWLHVGIDTFFQMMPLQFVGYGDKAQEGFHFITENDDQGPITQIENGDFGNKVVASIPKVISVLSKDHHLIVDEVLFGDDSLKQYVETLRGARVYFIGVYCDLKDLMEREILRGDRTLGMGRGQYDKVHGPTRYYDLKVDTTISSPFDCANEILNYVMGNQHPQSFKKLELAFQ